MLRKLTDDQWREYEELGYIKLGRIEPIQLRQMQDQIDSIMLGKASIDYARMLMQRDSETGAYEDAGAQTKGFKGATLDYRKIQDLEYDPIFLAYLQDPIFRDICARIHGEGNSISVFRAMLMNKPANKGTFLPWHQDRWTSLDRDPQITIWTALDPATKENGCIEVIPRSHRYGLINPVHASGFLSSAQAHAICTPDRIVYIELEPGEVVLLHNYLIHASDINKSSQSRRAFSVCYYETTTVVHGGQNTSPVAFGPNALKPEEMAQKPAFQNTSLRRLHFQ